MSMIIDGTNGLTFNNATTQASAGVVLQVVQGQLASTTGTTTTSSSYVTTGLTASITPKFSTSKILIIANGASWMSSSAVNSFYTIYKNSSNLNTGASPASLAGTYCGAAMVTNIAMSYLDSPATTSSTTYTVYFATSGGTLNFPFNPSGTGSTIGIITLMEIAG